MSMFVSDDPYGISVGEAGDPNAYTGVALNFVNVRRLRLGEMTIRNPGSFCTGSA